MFPTTDIVIQINPIPAAFPGGMSGVVVDSAGEGIEGVAVSVDSTSYTTITAANGTFTLSGMAPGNYTVRFTNTRFFPSTQPNTVISMLQTTSLPPETLTFVPEQNRGSISGVILATDATSVNGATVSLAGWGVSTLTDGTGSYTLTDVVAGNYTIIITHSSYFDSHYCRCQCAGSSAAHRY